jgi:hypothetical protein
MTKPVEAPDPALFEDEPTPTPAKKPRHVTIAINHLKEQRLKAITARDRASKHAECRGCGDSIEWWITPNQKKIPMNPMSRGDDPAVAHWASCTEQDSFRKRN